MTDKAYTVALALTVRAATRTLRLKRIAYPLCSLMFGSPATDGHVFCRN